MPSVFPSGRAPLLCPAGHVLMPGAMLVGWTPCDCPAANAGHRGHAWVKHDVAWCGAIVYDPACAYDMQGE